MTFVNMINLLVGGIWLLTGFSIYVFMVMCRNQARGWENSVCMSHRVYTQYNPTTIRNAGIMTGILSMVSVVALIGLCATNSINGGN